nr:FAD-binding protein [Leucobacter weissii]
MIAGSGVAGLSCALAASAAVEAAGSDIGVELVTPGVLRAGSGAAGGNTALAQGGIAVALGDGDAPRDHAADTIEAGAGLVDAEAARILTADGVQAARALLDAGFAADRDRDGRLQLGLEAAHGRPRILHAGEDRTGASLHDFLMLRVRESADAGRIVIRERTELEALRVDAGAVRGAVLRDVDGGASVVDAAAIVLATGGYGALFPRTSNQAGARGEGIVIAARAGALVADLEFVQFHPTVLDGTGFLISEAVRGAGAVLRDGSGERFMVSVHPAAELAPRDVVSRVVHRVLRERGEDAVWLDATGIERDGGAGTLARRFPRISATVAARGLDWTREPIPVSPATHYTMGGIATDLDGRSSLPGLYAAGETAATGVHGANRLASNSLLEGLVFGRRAGESAVRHAEAIAAGRTVWEPNGGAMRELLLRRREFPVSPQPPVGAQADRAQADRAQTGDAWVRDAVAAGLGIERDAAGLRALRERLAPESGMLAELADMVAVGAEARTESRGAHQRSDHPETDPAQRRRQAWIAPTVPDAIAVPTTFTDVRRNRATTSDTRSLAAC